MILEATDIQKILPHRYPFFLVDRIVEIEPLQSAVGIKCITFNEAFFQGHFPGNPVMPGVLILEAMALDVEEIDDALYYSSKIEKSKDKEMLKEEFLYNMFIEK